jgi:hypothetical protein
VGLHDYEVQAGDFDCGILVAYTVHLKPIYEYQSIWNIYIYIVHVKIQYLRINNKLNNFNNFGSAFNACATKIKEIMDFVVCLFFK